MSQEKRYRGQCFCGAVQIEVSGSGLAGAGYCHCKDCRKWSAGPVNAFTLWKRETVSVVKGESQLAEYRHTPHSHRQWCKECGGHVMTVHPQWGLVDVYAATIADFPFEPALHVHYASTVLPMKDGLPKMHDLPKEMGGSGETLPE
jgi:hypothetical protein